MDLRAFYADLGAVFEGGDALHFGAPRDEAAAAAGDGALLVPLLSVTPLRITGADRAGFLHGQLSNRVEGLPPGACNHTLQLNVRGQVVGEGLLCARESDLFLAVDDGRGGAVRASLEQHVVFDDVAIQDLGGELASLTLQGSGAAEALARALGTPPGPGAFARYAVADAEVLAAARKRSRAGGFDLHLLARQLPEVVGALREAGARLAGAPALTLARVLAGVPSAPHEGGSGALPQELGLEDALSHSKGCYLGQEIMARIEGRGAVRKGLARLRLEGPAEALASLAGREDRSLRLDGRDVGRLGSVARAPDGSWWGLAVLRRDLPADAPLDAGAVRGRLDPLETAST